MLVVTRKIAEAIVVPSLEVSLTVQSIEGRHVRQGVSAPPVIPVLRGEVSSRTNPQVQPESRREVVRVLLADADPLLIDCYAAHLSELGFDVTTAGNGVDCVARLRERTPHLIVLDAGLLWGRAEGVLAIIAERADVSDVPVLVTYEAAYESMLPVIRPFGGSDYAAKPLKPPQLAARIRELLALSINNDECKR